MASVLLATVVVCGCSGSDDSGAAGKFTPRDKGVLTVATAEVPTAGFWQGTAGKPTGGFEYELAQQLKERFGLDRVRIVVQPFSDIVAGHLGGADMAISLITPTQARESHLDFSSPYLTAPPAIVTRKGTDIPDLKTARKLRWVVQRGTTLEDIVRTQIDPSKPPLEVDTIDEKVAAVRDHKADAALFDFALAVALANESGGKLQVAAKMQNTEDLAVALPKDSGNTEAVSSGVRALVNDGTVDDLAQQWLGPQAAGSGEDVPVLRSSL